jgi:hypothetical protein
MRRTLRLPVAAMLALVLVFPLYAYHVALKNGRIIEFQRYRATETALLYVDDQGREISVPLGSIDLDRTRELNSKENPPLSLEDLIKISTSKNPDDQPSLGEVARSVRKKDASAARGRVFTNDDVAPASPTTTGALQTEPASSDTWHDRLNAFRATVGPLENMDASSLARTVLGNLDVDFPGRRTWEEQLSSRKDAVITALQSASHEYENFYHLRDVLKSVSTISKGDEEKLTQARMAVERAINQVQFEQSRLQHTIDAGKQRALEWKR